MRKGEYGQRDALGSIRAQARDRRVGVRAEREEFQERVLHCSDGARPVAGFPPFPNRASLLREAQSADELGVKSAHSAAAVRNLLAE